jgi:hypothetical protein
MGKGLRQRVADAFPGEGGGEADDGMVDFLHALRASWKDIATSLNRPRIERNDLDLMLQPPARAIFTGGHGPRKLHELRYERFRERLQSALLYPAFFLPLIFQVHAFYLLFRQFHASDVLVWASLVATAAIMIAAWALSLIWGSE